MDSQHFDQITKGLAHPASRRTAAKAMAIGAFGVALTALTAGRANAAEVGAERCRRNGKPCERDRQCCSRECHRDVCRRDRDRDRN